jgi:hypothetical protein
MQREMRMVKWIGSGVSGMAEKGRKETKGEGTLILVEANRTGRDEQRLMREEGDNNGGYSKSLYLEYPSS